MWRQNFLFWLSQFGVLFDSCTLIGTSFLRLDKYFENILCDFDIGFSTFYHFFYAWFVLFMVSQNSWLFYFIIFLKFLYLTVSLTWISSSSIISLILEFLSSVFCILLVRLSSEVLVWIPNFFLFPDVPQFGYPLLILFPFLCVEMLYLYPSTICLCVNRFL